MYSTIRATIASNVSRGMPGTNVGVDARGAAQPRQRAGEPLADLRDHAERALVARLDALLLDVGVGEDRDRVLEVVEGDERVGQHQREVGQPDRVLVRRAERLDRAHAVVAEEADRAARERRQAGQRRLALALHLGGGERVRVAAVGEAPAHDPARPVADERPAPDALALLGRLEQERRARAAQLQERGDGRLAVLEERMADRDEVVLGRERADLVEGRAHAEAQLRLSRDGHSAPPRRRRARDRAPRSSTARW